VKITTEVNPKTFDVGVLLVFFLLASIYLLKDPPPPPPPPPPPCPTDLNIDWTPITTSKGDPRVEDPIETYFAGINEHDGKKLTSVFSSIGQVNPYNDGQRNTYAKRFSTTCDSNITILPIKYTPFSGTSGWAVPVQFSSRQDAAYGPNGMTCTYWTETFQLVEENNSFKLLNIQEDAIKEC
jgi:hypothetical protein